MKTITTILLWASMSLCLISCDKSDLYPSGDVQIGQAAVLKLFLDDTAMTSKGAGLGDAQEKVISSVRIFVFDANGKVVTNKHFESYNSAIGIQAIDTRSGVNMSIYAIANISAESVNFNSMFENVKTISDLNDIKVYNLLVDVSQNHRLVMWGFKSGVTIPQSPSTITVTFALNYVASKVRLIVLDDTPIDQNVSFDDWQLQNVARFSYIIPRGVDAVNVASPTDYVDTTASFAWNDTIVGGKSGKYTVFYLFENRRGGRVANGATPPSGYTPGAIGGVDPRDKAWYAPNRATTIVVNGSYYESNKHTGIKAKIALGANSYNDYNVERANNYTYTVTVKGIGEIDVDSRIDGNSRGFQVDILATTLDAHYDWRPIRIGSYGANIDLQLLNDDNVTTPSWLKISTINLNQFVFDGLNYIRPTYNPATDMKSAITNITFVSGATTTFKMIYLYADEYLVEGGIRTAKIKVTSSEVGSTPIIIPITQRGFQTMGDVGLRKFSLLGLLLPSPAYKIGVENFEEATLNLTPGAATGAEKTNTMQWGFNAIDMQPITLGLVLFDNYSRNGYQNSLDLVMTNVTAATLRVPYGRTGGVISEQVHNPIFNSFAARYCFEKNRDVNGDGVIKGAEIKWYLPSLDELLAIYVGEPTLSQVAGENMGASTYQSSTEFTTATDNLGVQFNIGRSGTLSKTQVLDVRCIREVN